SGAQRLEELVCAGEVTGDRLADADGDGRRRRRAILDDVEVVIEGGDLVDLGRREGHLACECYQVHVAQAAVGVLNEVQVLDQEVGPARGVAEQGADLGQRLIIQLASLGRGAEGDAARVPAASFAWWHAGKV